MKNIPIAVALSPVGDALKSLQVTDPAAFDVLDAECFQRVRLWLESKTKSEIVDLLLKAYIEDQIKPDSAYYTVNSAVTMDMSMAANYHEE